MRVAVIGSGGFIGRRLVAALGAEGHDVCTFSSGQGTGIHPEAGLFPHDFAVPAGTETLIYLAQSPYYRQTPARAAHVLAVNALAPVQAALAATTAGARRFIFASSGSVYAPSFQPLNERSPLRRSDWYALSKVHGEESLDLFARDLQPVSVRLFGVYGPGQTDRFVPNLISSVQRGSPIRLLANPHDALDAEGTRISLCYVDDAVDILCRLARAGGPGRLNVAGPEPYSLKAIARRIGALVGRDPVFERSAESRESDVVADVSLLQATFELQFTPFSLGIEKTLAHGSSADAASAVSART